MIRAALLACLMLTGPQAWADDPQNSDDYEIGPRDEIEIDVFGEPDLTGPVIVGSDGTIPFPLIESLQVGGMTVSQVSAALANRLGEKYLVDPHVSVRVLAYKSHQVQVMGAVKTPGVYYLTGPTSLSQALLNAGWVDAQRSSGQVVVRRGTESFVFDLAKVQLGDANLDLAAGDLVTVPEGQWVWLQGAVDKPGQYLYTQGLTVSNAIALAGGPGEFGRKGGFVVRNGTKMFFNLKRIQDGKDTDIAMEPGDSLYLRGG